MKKISGLEPVLFYAFLALLLVPVWSVDFFVTGDGPCHLHNSKILYDWFHEKSRLFYDPFYFLNTNINPNLLFYLMTVPLMALGSPELAEKIFFSVYVISFGCGFRFLLLQINPNAKFLSSVALLFCYHTLLMKGFLNNSLSFAVWFWLAAWWWRKRDEFSIGVMTITSLLILLLYSAHPIGLTFGILMILSMITGLWVHESKEKGMKESLSMLSKRIQSLMLSGLPTIMLFVEYMMRSNMTAEKTPHHFKDSLNYISHLYSLVTLRTSEEPWALATSVFCLMIAIMALILRIRQPRLLLTDGISLFFVLVMLIIAFPPDSISGGLEVSYRLAIVPFMALLCWAATANFPIWTQITSQFIALIIGIGFLTIRLPVHFHASEYASEINSCETHITFPATVFVLNYDWEGHTPEGQLIADRASLFSHVDCYLGSKGTVIISDNYEAHFPYFPVIVRWNTNMYAMTDKEGVNFDNRPPRADILNYSARTGEKIDFVLMTGYTETFKDHPYTQEILAQLDQAYLRIYTSPHGKAVLYKRKDL